MNRPHQYPLAFGSRYADQNDALRAKLNAALAEHNASDDDPERREWLQLEIARLRSALSASRERGVDRG